MPVPKRKTSKARRDQRQSCKFIRPQSITKCSNCENPLGTHQACAECGFYKGKKVLTTKADRALKRGESRQALHAKAEKLKAKQEESEPAGHSE